MLESLRRNPRFYLLAAAAALALRLLFILRFPQFDGDSLTYGNLAVNLLHHHAYAFSMSGTPVPTWVRLPGYPLFLAGVFAVFGQEHYNAVRLVQMFVDLGTAAVLAATAGRLVSEKAARAAFLLTALCPFLANYVADPMPETVEIFCTALAFYCAVRGRDEWKAGGRGLRWWAGCGAAIGGAILLRPDGGMLVMVIGGYLLLRFLFRPDRRRSLVAGLVLGVVAFAPLVPWTLRNWHTFHRFMPLAPRYANEPGEFVALGFERWVKTWMAEYLSVEQFFWAPEGEADIHDLPARAFDSPEEYKRTEELIDAFNEAGSDVSPALDAQFAQLAEERIRRHPLRYYVWLPALRVADMWLRPRTEALPYDTHWWAAPPSEAIYPILLGLINLGYVLGAALGAWQRKVRYAGMLLAFVLLRSAYLGTLANPEPRYTLECYPAVIVFAAALAGDGSERRRVPALARAA